MKPRPLIVVPTAELRQVVDAAIQRQGSERLAASVARAAGLALDTASRMLKRIADRDFICSHNADAILLAADSTLPVSQLPHLPLSEASAALMVKAWIEDRPDERPNAKKLASSLLRFARGFLLATVADLDELFCPECDALLRATDAAKTTCSSCTVRASHRSRARKEAVAA